MAQRKGFPQFITGDAETVNAKIRRVFFNLDQSFESLEDPETKRWEWTAHPNGSITICYWQDVMPEEQV